MAKEGWISLYRPIQEHWIWKDANKFKWWIDILLTVNNTDAKVNIGNEIYVCKRGESLMSIQSWATRWNVSKDTARNFLKLLQNDNMINCVSLGKTTRLTVCKYDSYQQGLHVKQTPAVRSPYTNNNDNNENNNIAGFHTETTGGLGSIQDRAGKFIEHFNKTKLKFTKTEGRFRRTDDVLKKFKARVKDYKSEDIVKALNNAFNHQMHKEQNYQYLTPSYILREEILERYVNVNPAQLQSNQEVYTAPKAPISHS